MSLIIANYEKNKEKVFRQNIYSESAITQHGAVAAWEAGGKGLTEGVTQIAMAGILDATGGMIFGRCSLPDGMEKREGDLIPLNW